MEATQLYLDTARLGRMSVRAQEAQVDFTRLAGEEGASRLFENFLRDGSQGWPDRLRSRFAGLANWRGVTAIKHDIRILAGSKPELPVLLASRSAHLMTLAAKLLFRTCRKVLVTDLGWPPYQLILGQEAKRTNRSVSCVNLRSFLCDPRTTEEAVTELVSREFLKSGCDGLFLTAVSHLGFRLPIERLVRALEQASEVRFVVVDGAQEFCHGAANLSQEYCDLYLAGAHKWLEGFHPLGLGFYGRRESRGVIENVVADQLLNGELDDPLLRFTTQLESAGLDGETETVNLIPLFTCQGAATDALEGSLSLAESLQQRQQNRIAIETLAGSCGWPAELAAEPFRTAILLLQAERSKTRMLGHSEVRAAFAAKGVALTAYDGGFIRLSMPRAECPPSDMVLLQDALRSVA